jgi:hypothetical protein
MIFNLIQVKLIYYQILMHKQKLISLNYLIKDIKSINYKVKNLRGLEKPRKNIKYN